MYTIKRNSGTDDVKVKRVGMDSLEIKLGDKTAVVLTEDLAALVRAEMPEDRARELFSEIQDTMIKKGKARIVVEARNDIKKGEPVAFTVDITKYVDAGQPVGIRALPNGFIY